MAAPKTTTIKDLTGSVFGRLTALERSTRIRESDGKRITLWNCRCECGESVVVQMSNLTSGQVKSCGCLTVRHGGSLRGRRTPEYRAWHHMLERCRDPKNKRFEDYGGRGIQVCERWNKFEHFLEDVGQRPSNTHSIERTDNDKGYDPSNARWATRNEQTRNTRRNVFITFSGETLCLTDWATRYGIATQKIQYRLKSGWSIERALTVP